MNLFLDVHGDDLVLFGSFIAQSVKPVVVVVFDSYLQEKRGAHITALMRRLETEEALKILDLAGYFLRFRDDANNGYVWPEVETCLRGFLGEEPEHIFAPAAEEGGHVQHNEIGEIADKIWPGKVTHYLTYTNCGKSTDGFLVPCDGPMIQRKLRAMACYESQIELAATRPHFLRGIEEYVRA